jgi:hypothetical protein
VKSRSADIQSMEAAKDHAFTPPPRAWITNRIGELNHLLATAPKNPPSRSGA